jgi:hypothetical protein
VTWGGGCTIPETALRAITLPQLRELFARASEQCVSEAWTSTDPRNAGMALTPDAITLYDMVKLFVLPATKSRRCSYVELIASGPQKPDWFVSHWWGETVIDFIACLEQHAADRALPADAGYWVRPVPRPPQRRVWVYRGHTPDPPPRHVRLLVDGGAQVCAYANNQHTLDSELGGDSGGGPEHSPFFRALQLATGTVSVVDGAAIVFTRAVSARRSVRATHPEAATTDAKARALPLPPPALCRARFACRLQWCGFELYLSVIAQGPEYRHDIYTVVHAPTPQQPERTRTDEPLAARTAAGAAGGLSDEKGAVAQAVRAKRPPGLAVGLVDGFSALDTDVFGEVGDVSEKERREDKFPEALARAAGAFKINSAQASMPSDLASILGFIGADAPALDATVAARFCAARLARLLQRAVGTADDEAGVRAELDSLRASRLRRLVVTLPGRSMFRAKPVEARAAALGASLPRSLHLLHLERVGREVMPGVCALLESSESISTLGLEACSITDADVGELASAILANTSLGLTAAAEAAAALADARPEGPADDPQPADAQADSQQPLPLVVRGRGGRGSLRELTLNMNSLTDLGARLLGLVLSSPTNLESLDASNNSISDEGAAAIGEALGDNRALVTLRLSNNQIGPSGVAQWGKRGLGPTLRTLALSGNKLGEAGGASIAAALERPGCALTDLDLSFNKVGEQGLGALARALRAGASLSKLRLEAHVAPDVEVPAGGSPVEAAPVAQAAHQESLEDAPTAGPAPGTGPREHASAADLRAAWAEKGRAANSLILTTDRSVRDAFQSFGLH